MVFSDLAGLGEAPVPILLSMICNPEAVVTARIANLPLDGSGRWGYACQDDVGLQADQLLRDRLYPIDVTAAPMKVHPHVAAIGPTQARKCLRERRVAKLLLRG
jgi:hypothetical protein